MQKLFFTAINATLALIAIFFFAHDEKDLTTVFTVATTLSVIWTSVMVRKTEPATPAQVGAAAFILVAALLAFYIIKEFILPMMYWLNGVIPGLWPILGFVLGVGGLGVVALFLIVWSDSKPNRARN